MKRNNQAFILTSEEVKQLCIAGSLAPSGGNIQPWKVNVKKNELTISLDHTRSTSFLDVNHLASIFSIGSFVENVLIKADELGLSYQQSILPTRDNADFAVSISFTNRNTSLHANRDTLARFIHKRVTNRRISDGKNIETKKISVLKKLVQNTSHSYALATINTHDQKKILANILGKADAMRTLHTTLFSEMLNELRYSSKEASQTRDGIDINTLELPGNVTKMFTLLKRFPSIPKFLPREAFEDMVKPLILHSSHIGCLTTKLEINPYSLFTAGRIVEKIWLKTTKENIAFHPWTILTFFIIRIRYFNGEGFSKNQISEIYELESMLRNVFSIPHNEHPLFIFRLSYALPPTTNALRLDWKEFTTVE